MATKAYDRETLYREVWQTPMLTLAKRYGVSDQGLRKACRKLQVPLPKVGHWAKIAAGHKVPTPPLPPFSDHRPKHEPRPKLRPSVPDNIDEWLQPIEWPEDLHPALKRVGRALNSLLADGRAMRKQEARRKLRPPLSGPDWDSFGRKWSDVSSDGYLIKTTFERFAVRVSIFQYQRALLLLSQLCFRAESAGFKVSIQGESERVCFLLSGQTVRLRVSEKFEQIDEGARKTRLPTGVLRLHLDDLQAPSPALSDGPKEKLEGKMDLVLKAILRKHQAQTESAARWQEESRLQALERQRREAYEAEQAELRRVKAEELRRQVDLSREAMLWHRADMVRQYVSQLDGRVNASGEVPEGYAEWKAWALQSADAIDPTATRLGSFSEEFLAEASEPSFEQRSPIVIPDPSAPKEVPGWHPPRWFAKPDQ